MKKRLQVLLSEDEYRAVEYAASLQGVTVAEWVRGALRQAQSGIMPPPTAEGILRATKKFMALADASPEEHPTADIEDMLAEIEAGRRMS